MSSATTSEIEVDITNAKKLSSSDDTKAHLNPDAAVFETSLLSKDLVDKPEVETNKEPVAEMPSPQPIASPPLSGGGITINGNEPSVFADSTSGITRQSIPEHIKPDQLSKDELRSLVRQQLEYYFSRENLAGDTYLVSQMDSDQYVLIQIVANFNQMKKLTNDIELVKDAIRESAYLQMDDTSTKMRPNMKRCIVILREVPDSTSVEEVEELFSGEGCPKYISCEPAHNNYWYIQFESEEGAQKAYRYLREDIKTFKGQPIMARIKAKPIPRATSNNFPQKNGVRQPSEPTSMAAPPFRYPVSPVYGGHQPYSFFPSTMVSQWPPGQHYFDPTLISNLANNAYHTPHNFNKVNAHQGNRPYYQTNRNRNQTRSYREQSDRTEKDSSPPYRPRAHSTNGTSNTTNSATKSTATMNASNSSNLRRTDDEYRRPGPRTRRRRGSSEDIRTSRSPVPQEPPRSKDDSFQINLTSSQFPPLPSANVFKTAELPLQSTTTTRQDYNKVASSPPISPPITPTRIATPKQEKEETWKKPLNQTNDIEVKKEDIKKVDTKVSEPKPDTKNNIKSTLPDQKKEAAILSEKLSYAQIAQKKGQIKANQQLSVSATASTTTTVTTVAPTVAPTVAQAVAQTVAQTVTHTVTQS